MVRLGCRSATEPPHRDKHQHGQSSDGRHRAQQHLRSGQLIYEPALSGGLHPGSDQRYELTDEEQPEIAMFQGGKGVTP